MVIYRRGRIWYADFYNGKARLQVSTGTANKGKAEKFLALRISEVERGEYAKPTKITLAELGRQYMDYAKANKISWLRDEQILKHLVVMVHSTICCFPTSQRWQSSGTNSCGCKR